MVSSHTAHHLCRVAPHPDLLDRIHATQRDLQGIAFGIDAALSPRVMVAQEPTAPGLNDGLIIPGNYFPLGSSLELVRSEALRRAPMRDELRVIVALIDFDDQAMDRTKADVEQLFFSEGVMPQGSVKEYFDEVSGDLITITGDVVGPYRMPRKMTEYANGASGTGPSLPNARTMARDAAMAADPLWLRRPSAGRGIARLSRRRVGTKQRRREALQSRAGPGRQRPSPRAGSRSRRQGRSVPRQLRPHDFQRHVGAEFQVERRRLNPSASASSSMDLPDAIRAYSTASPTAIRAQLESRNRLIDQYHKRIDVPRGSVSPADTAVKSLPVAAARQPGVTTSPSSHRCRIVSEELRPGR